MQKSELKNLVFERFEERRLEIIKKRNRFQQELDQDLHQLREAYGDAAVNGLGDLSLTVTQPESAPTKERRMPTETPRERSRPKRKRRQRPAGTPTVRSLLEEHVPVAVAAVAESKEEFQARDIHDHLTNVSKLDISYGNVSLYLGQNAKKLGLSVEKRKVGEPIPLPTNFFRKGRAKAVKKSRRAKSPGRVDWEGNIATALKGLRKGLTQPQLKDKLVKAGVPEVKFKGAGFRGALARMVEQGTITLKDDRYMS